MKILSALSACIVALALIYSNLFYYPKWNKPDAEATIGWDVSGYYWYLPAFLIYEQPQQLPFAEDILKKYRPTPNYQQAFQHSNGNWVMKYPCGLSLQLLPAFLIAHQIAQIGGYPPDGFSAPYQLAVQLNGLLVALIGLFLFRKILLYYHEDASVAIVLLLLGLGSNYLNYVGIDLAMTHNYLFTWYCLLVYLSRAFHQSPSHRKAAAIGFCVGMMALTRPTELIAFLIPLLWAVRNGQDFRARIGDIFNNISKYSLAGLVVAAVGSVQLLYWKYAGGDWLVYSYQEQGFSWLRPHVWDYCMSFRSGWLIYSPMLAFGFLGILLLKKQPNSWAIFSFLLLNFYIVTAWDIWWYGGRAMVQSYPIWGFCLALLVDWLRQGRWLKYLFYSIWALTIYYNFWITHQWHKGGYLDGSEPTRRYLWAVVFRWDYQPELKKLLDCKDYFYGQPSKLQTVYYQDFEQDSSLQPPLPAPQGQRAEWIGGDKKRSADYRFALKTEQKWLRVSATFSIDSKEWDWWNMSQFITRFYQQGQQVKESVLRVQRYMDAEQTKRLFSDIRLPTVAFDSVELHFWNADGSRPLCIDELKAETFDE